LNISVNNWGITQSNMYQEEGKMNIYEVIGKWGEISHTAAHTIFDVCKGKNDDYKESVTNIRLLEENLGYYEVEHHTLPMDIIES